MLNGMLVLVASCALVVAAFAYKALVQPGRRGGVLLMLLGVLLAAAAVTPLLVRNRSTGERAYPELERLGAKLASEMSGGDRVLFLMWHPEERLLQRDVGGDPVLQSVVGAPAATQAEWIERETRQALRALERGAGKRLHVVDNVDPGGGEIDTFQSAIRPFEGRVDWIVSLRGMPKKDPYVPVYGLEELECFTWDRRPVFTSVDIMPGGSQVNAAMLRDYLQTGLLRAIVLQPMAEDASLKSGGPPIVVGPQNLDDIPSMSLYGGLDG